MTSKLGKKPNAHKGHFANHKSVAYEGQVSFQPTFSEGNNFENTLRSLAVKPFGYLNHKKHSSNTDSINNFKSIIDRQNQNQRFIKIEESKYQIPILKKSSLSSNNSKRIFNSCIENVDYSRPLSNTTVNQGMQCINKDGNQVIVILCRQNIRQLRMKKTIRSCFIVQNVRFYWSVRASFCRKSKTMRKVVKEMKVIVDR